MTHGITLLVAPYIASFQYWIIDILFYNNYQIDKCKLECYDYLKKSILFFNKFQLILLCLIVPKMKKVFTKYVACYSNN